jgi:hypothetical protein
MTSTDGGASNDAVSGADGGGGMTIQDVQNDATPVGTPVTLHGVIVTAIDTFGTRVGDMWIEEPGGGAFSGVHVFNAPLTEVSNLKVGDVVDIAGAIKAEFAVSSDTTGKKVTELTPSSAGSMTVTRTGTASVPTPATVDLAALGALQGAAQDAEYEKWEGVLVTVTNAAAQSAPIAFSGGASPPDDSFGVAVDANLTVDSNLAGFPTGVDPTTCFASLTGVVDYISKKWVLYPRETSEMVLGGTGCAAVTVTPTTVANIQNGTVAAGASAKLSGVFVTARELTSTGGIGERLWVADSLRGASQNGILIFFTAAIDPSFAVGAQIDVRGKISEFGTMSNTLTELTNPVVTLVDAPGAPPTPVTLPAAQVTGEAYEGVLVQITNAKVTAIGAHNQVTLTDNAGGSVILDDDVFFGYTGTATASVPAMGACFASITGVMNVQTDDNVATLNPRSAADMVTGDGCN